MKTTTKRSTIYLDPELHHALRIKAADTKHSISGLVNEAVKLALAEDALDLASIEKRRDEPLMVFESVLKKLRKNGKI